MDIQRGDRMMLHVRGCIVGLLITLNAGVVGGSQKSSTPSVAKPGVCLTCLAFFGPPEA
jgi:hypothetical protein